MTQTVSQLATATKTALTVTFKAKVESVHYLGDDEPSHQFIRVPKLAPRHCNMSAFRVSKKFGHYSNSDLFIPLLQRTLNNAGIYKTIRLDRLPAGVVVDTSKFLAVVTITLQEG